MIPGITASHRRSSQAPPGGDDPYWDSVVLLMHLDGNANDVRGGVFNNTGAIAYAAGKFGQALDKDASFAGLVEATPRTLMNLPGDFTIEGWMKPIAGGGAFLSRFTGGSVGAGWQIYVEGSGKLSFYQVTPSGGTYAILEEGPSMTDGKWHHIAFCRSGTELKMFSDGVNTATGGTNADYSSATALL